MTTLAAIIRRVESSDGTAVMRFEPACYQAVVNGHGDAYCLHPAIIVDRIMAANRCSLDTAHMIFATSWGDYQWMGFLLFSDEGGYTGSIAELLGNPDTQDDLFARWCARHGFDPRGGLPDDAGCARFAQLYNGPGAVDSYVAAMKRAAAQLA